LIIKHSDIGSFREMLGCSPDQLVQLLTRKLNAPTAV